MAEYIELEKRQTNKNNELHCETGPAVKRADGSVEYWVNGRQYSQEDYEELSFKREELSYYDGPRTTWHDWRGQLHRHDGPAVVYHNRSTNQDNPPTQHWLIHGNKHRLEGPASEYNDGAADFCIHGKYVLKKDVEEHFRELGEKTILLIAECLDIISDVPKGG